MAGGKVAVVERVSLCRAGERAGGAAGGERLCGDLWALQYRARGVLCASAGAGGPAVPGSGARAFTHGVHHRFKDWEALQAFEADALVTEAERGLEACEDAVIVRWEGRVESDIFPLFQRGDEWDAGLEHLLVLGGEDLAGATARGVEEVMAQPDLAPLIQRMSHGLVEQAGELPGDPFGVGEAYAVLLRCRGQKELDAVTGHPCWQAVTGAEAVRGAFDFNLSVLPVEGAENVM